MEQPFLHNAMPIIKQVCGLWGVSLGEGVMIQVAGAETETKIRDSAKQWEVTS
jgi:hypothetical protein